MKCPVCEDQNLVMSERQNVEIDYCPNCRGIWLDRGELDKIIERAAPELEPGPAQTPQRQAPPPPRDHRYEDHDSRYQKKRKHWLMELFD